MIYACPAAVKAQVWAICPPPTGTSGPSGAMNRSASKARMTASLRCGLTLAIILVTSCLNITFHARWHLPDALTHTHQRVRPPPHRLHVPGDARIHIRANEGCRRRRVVAGGAALPDDVIRAGGGTVLRDPGAH